MNCTEFESILADYLDGTLSSVERAGVDQHALNCSACSEFMAEVSGGLAVLRDVAEIEPPAELITRIAYQTPMGKTLDPFERQSWLGRLSRKWLMPVLQPRLAMGVAMTILSFTMLERCTGVQTQHIQAADLSPIRVWGGVEDRTMRVKDRFVKYYDNLKIVYEIETRLKDLQDQQTASAPKPARTAAANSMTRSQNQGSGASKTANPQPPSGSKP